MSTKTRKTPAAAGPKSTRKPPAAGRGRGRKPPSAIKREPGLPVYSPERAYGFAPGQGYRHHRRAKQWATLGRGPRQDVGTVGDQIADFVARACGNKRGIKKQVRDFIHKVRLLHLNAYDIRNLVHVLAINQGNYGLKRGPYKKKPGKESPAGEEAEAEAEGQRCAVRRIPLRHVASGLALARTSGGRGAEDHTTLLWEALSQCGCENLKLLNAAIDQLALGTLGVPDPAALSAPISVRSPGSLGTVEDEARLDAVIAEFMAAAPQCGRAISPETIKNFLALLHSKHLTASDVEAVANNLATMGYIPRIRMRPHAAYGELRQSPDWPQYSRLPKSEGEWGSGIATREGREASVDRRTQSSRLLWNIVLHYGCEDGGEGLSAIFNALNFLLTTDIMAAQGKATPERLREAYEVADELAKKRGKEKYARSGLPQYWGEHKRRLPAAWRGAPKDVAAWQKLEGGGWVQR